jgi:predicted dienelactone hydrolase
MLSTESSQQTSETVPYDPFVRGRFPVGVRTIEALDTARNRLFPCEIWYPESAEGSYPVVVYSHHSGGGRRAATYLCDHLASHGYVVAALDHSEVIAEELKGKEGETSEQLSARVDAWIANRVPDIRFLLDHLLSRAEVNVDPDRIGIVGHSFGGWTALAMPEVDTRIRAVVALGPGGNARPRPGILPLKLSFEWGRDVPTLYLAAENDVPIPLDGVYELFERTPSAKQMVILRRADHYHFLDNVEEVHEMVRVMTFPANLAWMTEEMRPIGELCSGEQAHLLIRGLTVCHMDAVLRQQEEARRFLGGDIEAELAARGVDVIAHK